MVKKRVLICMTSVEDYNEGKRDTENNEEGKLREGNARGARAASKESDGRHLFGGGGADLGFVGLNLSRRSASPRPTSRTRFKSVPAGIIIVSRISRKEILIELA